MSGIFRRILPEQVRSALKAHPELCPIRGQFQEWVDEEKSCLACGLTIALWGRVGRVQAKQTASTCTDGELPAQERVAIYAGALGLLPDYASGFVAGWDGTPGSDHDWVGDRVAYLRGVGDGLEAYLDVRLGLGERSVA